MAEAAAAWQVDRSTVMRIRTVAKEGALAALSESRPGVKGRERDYELEAAKAENASVSDQRTERGARRALDQPRTGDDLPEHIRQEQDRRTARTNCLHSLATSPTSICATGCWSSRGTADRCCGCGTPSGKRSARRSCACIPAKAGATPFTRSARRSAAPRGSTNPDRPRRPHTASRPWSRASGHHDATTRGPRRQSVGGRALAPAGTDQPLYHPIGTQARHRTVPYRRP